MISFELFLERCQPPVEVLEKYKDDPDVYISFTNIIEPRAKKEGTGNDADKSTTRIGLNPLTSYDTPAGVYTYPLKAYWHNIKNYSIPFQKDMPYVYVIRPKRPEKCARASTYTEEDFQRDFEELKEIYPQYHLDDLIKITSAYGLEEKYPEYDSITHNIVIGSSYRTPPLRLFWSITRSLAYLLLHDIKKKQETKTKHITVWTHVMRQFYDGIVDDTGSSIIHSNEPIQAVFWNNSYFNVIDRIDRTCGKKKNTYGSIGRDEWMGLEKQPLKQNKLFDIIKKAYQSNTEHKLNPGLKKLLTKNGLNEVLDNANQAKIDIAELARAAYPDKYKELALGLFLAKTATDEKIFDDNVFTFTDWDFIKKNAPRIAYLLKDENSEQLANQVLSVMITSSDYEFNATTEPLYLKLLKLSKPEHNTYKLADILNNMVRMNGWRNLSKTPKTLSRLINLIGKNPDVYAYGGMNSTVSDLIRLVRQTRTKNPSIWRKFIPYFRSAGADAHVLEQFIEAKTGVEEELKDYINSKDSPSESKRNQFNNIWQKYYGVDLYRPNLSQFDTIKKARKARKIVGTPPKYNEGDIVIMQSHGGLKYGTIKFLNPNKHMGEYRYGVEWENDTQSIEYEYNLHSEEPQFESGEIVEDGDGNIYKIITIYDDSMSVKNAKMDNVVLKNLDDIIPYNPKTSLHKPKFNNGDMVKINGGMYNGQVGRVLLYEPEDYFRRPYTVALSEIETSISEDNMEPYDGPQSTQKGNKITKDNINAGDKVICISNTGYEDELTIGKEYITDSFTSTCVRVKNDEGNVRGYYFYRFNYADPTESYDPPYKEGDVLIGGGYKYVFKKNVEPNSYTYDIYTKEDNYEWTPYMMDVTYPISDFDDSGLTLEKPDALEGYGFDTDTPKYKKGDHVIIAIGALDKYPAIITNYNPDTKFYEVSYEWKNGDIKYTGVQEDQMELEDALTSKSTKPKYNKGDVFPYTNGIMKAIVMGFDESLDVYHVIYYEKKMGYWETILNDKFVNREKFEKDIEEFTKDKILYHDIKI